MAKTALDAQRLPVVPLSGAVLYPGAVLTVALPSATAGTEGKRVFAAVTLPDGPADFGTEALVTGIVRLPNGEPGAVLRGLGRCRAVGYTRARGRTWALVEAFSDRAAAPGGSRARRDASATADGRGARGDLPTLVGAVRMALARVAALRAGGGAGKGGPWGYPPTFKVGPPLAAGGNHSTPSGGAPRLGLTAGLPEDPTALGFQALAQVCLPIDEQLRLLAATNPAARLRAALKALSREEQSLRLSLRLHDKATLTVQEGQRRQLLKEQVRLLQSELGEDGESETDELTRLGEELAALQLPHHAREAAARELTRMELMPPGSPDYLVCYSYLQWIKDLPWGLSTRLMPPSLETARRQLNKEHFGLGAAKERILEYLAVMRLKGQTHGEILLLVGPPGVGKSSLARQIARALGRPFGSIALGGVRDEAEIRGHRRTYVGAMPGKLLHAVRQTKSAAPVILLDEIDKVGLDHGRGALSSALLEVLDYETNSGFVDHYLGIPYDLSNVLFIATANDVAPIPAPLLDRMELVEMPSYTEPEKLAIARRHLLPELTRELGLGAKPLAVPDAAIRQVIRAYTREAGVRQLRRELSALGRKTVKALVDGRRPPSLAAPGLRSLLGPPKYLQEPHEARLPPGVALGLAYTEVGGDILYIESTRVPAPGGRGGLALTGHLGKVMKESAQAAVAYVKSLAHLRPDLLPLDLAVLAGSDIHLHLPSGATPKDGPSAGLAIVCAVAGLLSGRALPAKLAMTGEITLRGQVLPVGGLKEKLLAAHRYGKTRVVIPAGNVHDLETLPKEVRRALEIIPVQTMEEALTAAGLLHPALALPKRHLRLAHGRI